MENAKEKMAVIEKSTSESLYRNNVIRSEIKIEAGMVF